MKLLAVLLLAVTTLAAQTTHSVALTCTASTTLGVTYNFLRGNATSGPYSQINLGPTSVCNFTDSLVTNGTTYFYVAVSFDATTGSTSGFSNEVKAVIPSAPAPPTNLTATIK
jgi:hypothetical protein